MGLCWFVSLFSQSNHLCYAYETSFRKDTNILCYVFYVLCHVKALLLVFLSLLNSFLAGKLAFCMLLETIQIHKSPMPSLLKVLVMQVASLCQSLSHNDRFRLGHSDHLMTDFKFLEKEGGGQQNCLGFPERLAPILKCKGVQKGRTFSKREILDAGASCFMCQKVARKSGLAEQRMWTGTQREKILTFGRKVRNLRRTTKIM